MDFMLTPGVIGGIAGGLAVVALGLLLPRKSCPKCNSLLPRLRKPEGFRETMLGGWHCPSCRAKIGRNGKLLPE